MSIEAPSQSSFFLMRDKIEKEIAKSILSFGEKTRLRDACEYALLSGGKRLRPLIVLMVADGLGNDLNVVPSALAVEFMHTASLIADDLPCMDNEDERREKPSLHRVHSESIAILSSYSLIFAGYQKIYENAQIMRLSPPPFDHMADSVCSIAIKCASQAAGIQGATAGQFLDLYPPKQNWEMVKEVLYKKTVTLFEVAFIFGWLFGGGVVAHLDKVKRAAYHFGMAFQIADDLGDLKQDETNQREMNAAKILGPTRAFELFQKDMKSFKTLIADLRLNTPSFEKMCKILSRGAAVCV